MLGIKQHKATSLLGVKQHAPMRVIGHKTYGANQNIVNAQPRGDHKNGIVNESNGTAIQREPLRNNYKPPRQNSAGIEKR